MNYWREIKDPYLDELYGTFHAVRIADGKAYAPWWATQSLLDGVRVALFGAIVNGDLRQLAGAGL